LVRIGLVAESAEAAAAQVAALLLEADAHLALAGAGDRDENVLLVRDLGLDRRVARGGAVGEHVAVHQDRRSGVAQLDVLVVHDRELEVVLLDGLRPVRPAHLEDDVVDVGGARALDPDRGRQARGPGRRTTLDGDLLESAADRLADLPAAQAGAGPVEREARVRAGRAELRGECGVLAAGRDLLLVVDVRGPGRAAHLQRGLPGGLGLGGRLQGQSLRAALPEERVGGRLERVGVGELVAGRPPDDLGRLARLGELREVDQPAHDREEQDPVDQRRGIALADRGEVQLAHHAPVGLVVVDAGQLEVDLGHGGVLEDEAGGADPDARAVDELRLRDHLVVDERAVGRAEVADRVAVEAADDLAVVARDVGVVGHHDGVRVLAADRGPLGVELDLVSLAVALGIDQRAGAGLDIGAGGGRVVERQFRSADADDVAVLECLLLDEHAVEQRPVGRAEVLDLPTALELDHGAVPARRLAVRDGHLAVGRPADRRRVQTIERELLLLAGLGAQNEFCHRLVRATDSSLAECAKPLEPIRFRLQRAEPGIIGHRRLQEQRLFHTCGLR
jgi:hypothetical protein